MTWDWTVNLLGINECRNKPLHHEGFISHINFTPNIPSLPAHSESWPNTLALLPHHYLLSSHHHLPTTPDLLQPTITLNLVQTTAHDACEEEDHASKVEQVPSVEHGWAASQMQPTWQEQQQQQQRARRSWPIGWLWGTGRGDERKGRKGGEARVDKGTCPKVCMPVLNGNCRWWLPSIGCDLHPKLSPTKDFQRKIAQDTSVTHFRVPMRLSNSWITRISRIIIMELGNLSGTPFQEWYDLHTNSIIPWYGNLIPYHTIPYHHSKPVTGCLGSFFRNMKIVSAGCNTGPLGSISCGAVLLISSDIVSFK